MRGAPATPESPLRRHEMRSERIDDGTSRMAHLCISGPSTRRPSSSSECFGGGFVRMVSHVGRAPVRTRAATGFETWNQNQFRRIAQCRATSLCESARTQSLCRLQLTSLSCSFVEHRVGSRGWVDRSTREHHARVRMADARTAEATGTPWGFKSIRAAPNTLLAESVDAAPSNTVGCRSLSFTSIRGYHC